MKRFLLLVGALAVLVTWVSTIRAGLSPPPVVYLPLVHGEQSTPVPTATPAPESGAVHVLSNHSHFDYLGQWVIYGEVRNGSARDIDHIRFNLDFFDAGGRIVASESFESLDFHLPAGVTSCFAAAWGRDQLPGWSSVGFRSTEYWRAPQPLVTLSALHTSTSIPSPDSYRVDGWMHNTSSTATLPSSAVTTLYTDAGIVAGCSRILRDTIPLAPGEMVSFEANFAGRPHYSDITGYKVQAFGAPQQ